MNTTVLEEVEGVDDVTAWLDEKGDRIEVRIDISADSVDRTEMLATLTASLQAFIHRVRPCGSMAVDITVYARDGQSCVTRQDLPDYGNPIRGHSVIMSDSRHRDTPSEEASVGGIVSCGTCCDHSAACPSQI
jgi:hypothetical protein